MFTEDREPPRRRVPRTLVVILGIQACLSLLLATSNTAFGDEALYMWAGHVELTNWFGHVASTGTAYNDYFSGAPQLYPPLAAIAVAQGLSDRLLRCALLGAAFVVPVYQILIAKTGWALDKHLACGMWCVALVAGLGLASVSWPQVKKPALVTAASVALAVPVFDGWFSAYGIQRSWPDMTSLVAAVRPLMASEHGTMYIGATPSYLDYYTWPASLRRVAWKSSISLDPPQHGSPASYYRNEIRKQAPGLVVLFFPGYLRAQSLPADVFRVLHARKDARSDLAQVGAVNSPEPGAYEFALALEQDPRYRLVSSGPVNSGYGSYGLEPSTFFIWQRTKTAPRSAHR